MLRLAAAIAFLCLISSPVNAFQVSCEDVRAFVAEHGKLKALAFAVQSGATPRQINDARKCLTYAQAK
jgi:hypothetical protein